MRKLTAEEFIIKSIQVHGDRYDYSLVGYVNPVESADIDNCITLCKYCHNTIHSENGCGYNNMKRQPCMVQL